MSGLHDIYLVPERTPQFIDIGAILAAKAGRPLPKPVVWALARIIHEREINYVLNRYKDAEGVAFMNNLIDYFDVDISWEGAEHLPSDGRALFVSNHPLGGFDGICLSHLIGARYGDVRYIVNDVLYYLKPLQKIFLPVNKLGGQRRENMQKLADGLASDYPVVTFPAGLCSRRIKGKVQDIEWAKSFVTQAIDNKRDVVPIFFEGRNSRHFYALEYARRLLGIKFNFGMVLLPDEMFRRKGKSYRALVGKPIPWQELCDMRRQKSPKQIAQEVRAEVYRLAEDFR